MFLVCNSSRKQNVRCFESRESGLESDGHDRVRTQLVQGEVLLAELHDQVLPPTVREQFLHTNNIHAYIHT